MSERLYKITFYMRSGAVITRSGFSWDRVYELLDGKLLPNSTVFISLDDNGYRDGVLAIKTSEIEATAIDPCEETSE